MAFQVNISWRNDNPNTIYNRLAAKLGREPSRAEIIADLKRISDDVRIEMAGKGQLPHQRKG